MGLDSVELLMEWEKYFDIEIPDLVAEKMATVQEAVDAIALIMNVEEEGLALKEQALRRLESAIQHAGVTEDVLQVSGYVYHVIPDNNRQVWETISHEMELEIPLPSSRPDDSIKSKLLGFMFSSSDVYYDEITFSQLIDVIYGANYLKMINPKTISTKYEIYSVIMALTVDKIGIDYYEFYPDGSFTKDFGID